MDDTCTVCAESLEWVAYSVYGHREVCSTCVCRLRFIYEDRRCCTCKTESNVVFITKALGDYTTNIADFEVFSKEAREGKNGSYWYHEDTGVLFVFMFRISIRWLKPCVDSLEVFTIRWRSRESWMALRGSLGIGLSSS